MIYQISESFDSPIFLSVFQIRNLCSTTTHAPKHWLFTSQNPRRFYTFKVDFHMIPWNKRSTARRNQSNSLECIQWTWSCLFPTCVLFCIQMSFLWPGFLSNGRIISTPTNLRIHPKNSMVLPSPETNIAPWKDAIPKRKHHLPHHQFSGATGLSI